MMRAVLLAAALLSQCNTGVPQPAPTPEPPSPWDSGSPEQHATCEEAYTRQFSLGCPPAEDAHYGWRDIDCPKLAQLKIDTIAKAHNCAETR